MKTWVRFTLAVLTAALTLPLCLARAEGMVRCGDWQYYPSYGNAANVEYLGPGGDVVIPETLDGCAVVSLNSYAFNKRTDLRSVTIPRSVTKIGWAAFYGCSGLTEIAIPDSVSILETGAFCDCTGLKTITLPGSVALVGDGAFLDCTGLESVTFEDGVTEIGLAAFEGCTNLKSVYIPKSVNVIGKEAFYGCASLETVYYGGSLQDWEAIATGDLNEPLLAAEIRYDYTPIRWGDADGNGKVNNRDVVRLKNYLANYDDETGLSTVEIFAGADANGDGVVNNKDIVRLKNYLANLDDETGLSTVTLGPA